MEKYTFEDLNEEIGEWLDKNEDKWEWGNPEKTFIKLLDQTVPNLIKECVRLFNEN